MSETTDAQEDKFIKTASDDKIDPFEGTYSEITDEGPSCSAPRTTSGDYVQCEKCQRPAKLALFRQRTTPNSGKQEDLYRNFCETCELFFGMCSKKVRGVYSYCSEDGRILTISEKLDYLCAEKKRMTVSRRDSDEQEAQLPHSDSSTTANSEEKEGDEGIEMEQEKSVIDEKKAAANPRGRKPIGGKKKKVHHGWSNAGKYKNKNKEIVASKKQENSPTKASARISAAQKKEQEVAKEKKTESKGRGRPSKIAVKTTVRSVTEVVVRPALKPALKAADTSESEVQTDADMLLKSTYMADLFDETMKNGLSEQIVARLEGQPLILKKQFVMMMRTIEEQGKIINNYRAREEKFQLAVRKLKEFGRTTRLTYSDSFREIRADLVERKEEFKAHEAEVASLLKKQKDKYEEYKRMMLRKYEDFQLEKASLESKIKYLEEEVTYERERAAFFHRTRDVYQKERNEAVETAETAVKNLNDKLFVAKWEKCVKCNDIREAMKRMEVIMAEKTTRASAADTERNQMVEKASLYESAAQKLGRDCDSIKYERDSWKAYAEKYKKEVNKLNQTVKEKDRELAEKVAEIMATPKSIVTPKSVACTPSDVDRVSPPEDGEIVDTPPQASPMNASRAPAKPLVQKIVEKKAALPIASGFESWIPKEALNAPAPEIPKARSAFGNPGRTPQKEPDKVKLPPSQQPLPWEKPVISSSPSSKSLADALSRAQAEQFLGPMDTNSTSYVSKSYTEEINRALKSRKRSNEETEVPKKTDPVPTPKKQKQTIAESPSVPNKIAPAIVNSPSTSFVSSNLSSVGSLANMKKIPKLSDKPPQAEFAPALGVKEASNSTIPGLGMIDDNTKEKEKMEMSKKIQPPIVVSSASKPAAAAAAKPPIVPNATPNQKQQQHVNNTHNIPQKNISPKNKKKNKAKSRPDQFKPKPLPWEPRPSEHWRNQPPQQQQQPYYGIQSNQGRSQMDYRIWSDEIPSQRNSGGFHQEREIDFNALPWHKTQNTPFGKLPIQDQFGPSPMGPPPMGPPRPHNQPQSFFSPPRDNGYPPRPLPPPQQYGFPPQLPQGRGDPRSFYN
ncbi:unnamed protein product [Caenorhabditis sp. 36 PRJEB53466]|nr:unnamed protein product [Caenorhabditis sp. 36 PRJEB53466]